MTKPPTLSLINIYKRFGDIDAVSDVTINVNPGEVVGFIGPNGAGKTTTISLIMGFIRPTKGTVSVLGNFISPQSAHIVHRKIGYVGGDMALPGGLTGSQYLSFCASVNGRDSKQYDILLNQLSPVLNKPLKNLSRGNKQKISLIAALQHRPGILILDEPTSGLDPLMQEVFLNMIQHAAKRGATVFMSSHILSEISSICSRIIFMKAGKLIVDKPIGIITSQLGKQVLVTSHEPKNLVNFLPKYVQLLSHDKTDVRIAVPSDSLQPFMRWLLTKNFSDLTIENRDLDDVFQELYGRPKRRKLS